MDAHWELNAHRQGVNLLGKLTVLWQVILAQPRGPKDVVTTS